MIGLFALIFLLQLAILPLANLIILKCKACCCKKNRVGSASGSILSSSGDDSLKDSDSNLVENEHDEQKPEVEHEEQKHENAIASGVAPIQDQAYTVNEVANHNENGTRQRSGLASSAVAAVKPTHRPVTVVRVRTDGNRIIKEHVKE